MSHTGGINTLYLPATLSARFYSVDYGQVGTLPDASAGRVINGRQLIILAESTLQYS